MGSQVLTKPAERLAAREKRRDDGERMVDGRWRRACTFASRTLAGGEPIRGHEESRVSCSWRGETLKNTPAASQTVKDTAGPPVTTMARSSASHPFR